MLPFGHISVSYFISQIPWLKGPPLKRIEILFILFCGIIFDFDFAILYLLGIPAGFHHYSPTHTPLAGLIYFLILYFLFRKRFSRRVFALAGLAMLGHLMLDDLSYWLGLLGLEENMRPQIFWLYPFDPRRAGEREYLFEIYSQGRLTTTACLKCYLANAPKVFFLEIVFSLAALCLYTKHRVFKGCAHLVKK